MFWYLETDKIRFLEAWGNYGKESVEFRTRIGWNSQGRRKEGAGGMGKILRNVLQRSEDGGQRSEV